MYVFKGFRPAPPFVILLFHAIAIQEVNKNKDKLSIDKALKIKITHRICIGQNLISIKMKLKKQYLRC